jgi:DUF1009 family protein
MHAPLGIIAGRGRLPHLVLTKALELGRSCALVCLDADQDFSSYEGLPPSNVLNVSMGDVSKTIEFLNHHKVKEIVFAGGVTKPKFSDLPLDGKGVTWMARIGLTAFKGDDALLRKISELFEEEGFQILSPANFISAGLENLKILEASTLPTTENIQDVNLARHLLQALSPYDIGQAVTVYRGQILGLEGPEGTDALIRRSADLRRESQGGILVKALKEGQLETIDVPTVGPQTLELLGRTGFEGLAVDLNAHFIYPEEMRKIAEKYNIFIHLF